MTESPSYSNHSHAFDTGIAQQYGVNAAIVLNHIIYWLRVNASRDDVSVIDNKIWMHESREQMGNCLSYLTEKEIRGAIKKLVDGGILITRQFQKHNLDHRMSYTVSDQSQITKGLRNSKNVYETAKRADRSGQKGTSVYIYNNNKIKEEAKASKKSSGAVAPEPSADASALVKIFFSSLQKLNPNLREPDFKRWARELDKLLSIDKVPKERIEKVLAWLPTNPFWAKNVLSAAKLREKFERLETEMLNPNKIYNNSRSEFGIRLKNPNCQPTSANKPNMTYVNMDEVLV